MRLDAGFEGSLQEALLDDAEDKLVGRQANLVYEVIELIHTRLRAYGQRHGYDVGSTIDSLAQPEVTRKDDSLTIRFGWESEQMARWEFGVSPHTIDGNPVLSFVWEDPPGWVKSEFDQARSSSGEFQSGWRVFFSDVEHPGIPESRAIRDSLRAFREVLR